MNANERDLPERGPMRITRVFANKSEFASLRVHSRFPVSFALACALIGFASHRADALDQDLRRFVAAKESQARELAKTQTNKVPSIVWSFFDAVRVDDWETATNLGARLSRMSGQSEGANE